MAHGRASPPDDLGRDRDQRIQVFNVYLMRGDVTGQVIKAEAFAYAQRGQGVCVCPCVRVCVCRWPFISQGALQSSISRRYQTVNTAIIGIIKRPWRNKDWTDFNSGRRDIGLILCSETALISIQVVYPLRSASLTNMSLQRHCIDGFIKTALMAL